MAVDDPSESAGTIRVANRNTIVERHKKGVGIPIKRRMQSATSMTSMIR